MATKAKAAKPKPAPAKVQLEPVVLRGGPLEGTPYAVPKGTCRTSFNWAEPGKNTWAFSYARTADFQDGFAVFDFGGDEVLDWRTLMERGLGTIQADLNGLRGTTRDATEMRQRLSRLESRVEAIAELLSPFFDMRSAIEKEARREKPEDDDPSDYYE